MSNVLILILLLVLLVLVSLQTFYILAVKPLEDKLNSLRYELSKLRVAHIKNNQQEDYPHTMDYGDDTLANLSSELDNSMRDIMSDDPLGGSDVWQHMEELTNDARAKRTEPIREEKIPRTPRRF